MTHFTGHVPSPLRRERTARRTPEALAALLSGVIAASLGFGILAVLVLFLWITSPFPDSGPDGALRVAAALWLLAHGADLVRGDALTGGTVPVGVTPLLLAALPCWLLYRAAAHALSPDDDVLAGGAPEREKALGTLPTTGWLLAGYLTTAVVLLVFAQGGGLRANLVSVLLNVPLVAAGSALCGAWSAAGRHEVRPAPMLRRTLDRLGLPVGGVGAACWAGVSGAAVLFGGGALLAAGALAWHGGAVTDAFATLTSSLSGRFAVLLLTVSLVPNAAVWAAAYALGPGFALGTGSSVSPAGAFGLPPALPNFPLLAALPGADGPAGAPPLTWLVGLLPLTAAVLLAVRVCRDAAARRWSVPRTLAVAVLAAVAYGAVVAVVAAFAGGPMGVGTLAVLGPDGLRTGTAATGWALAVGIPLAPALRWWTRRRDAGPGGPVPARPRVLRVPEPAAEREPLAPPVVPDAVPTVVRDAVPDVVPPVVPDAARTVVPPVVPEPGGETGEEPDASPEGQPS